MILFDPESEKVVYTQESSLNLQLGGVTGNTVTMLAGGTTTLFQVVKAVVDPSQIKMETVMDIPDDLKEKLVHSTVERLEIPTFDVDSLTGKQRILHAYLSNLKIRCQKIKVY